MHSPIMYSLQDYDDDVFITQQQSTTDIIQELFQVNKLVVGAHLGSGGFGSVSECYLHGKKYALKRFHKTQKNVKAARESFDSEKTILDLCHPNIVRTYITFTAVNDATHCVLMEYVSRKTLQSVIDDSIEGLDFTRRTNFATDIAEGLKCAHTNNIAHLDLKPANILITATGRCKIADFGCCQKIGVINQPSTPTKSNLTGTYSYRAPELLRGEVATTKADIYSFGICLWQMLVRERPFGNEHHQVIIFKVVAYNLRPKVPTKMNETDSEYVKLMERCWNKDKNIRPTADSILKQLA